MPDSENRNDPGRLIAAAKAELAAMGKEGLGHPSSKPVLIGAAAGALAGGWLLDGSWVIGLLLGAGIALYLRIRT